MKKVLVTIITDFKRHQSAAAPLQFIGFEEDEMSNLEYATSRLVSNVSSKTIAEGNGQAVSIDDDCTFQELRDAEGSGGVVPQESARNMLKKIMINSKIVILILNYTCRNCIEYYEAS